MIHVWTTIPRYILAISSYSLPTINTLMIVVFISAITSVIISREGFDTRSMNVGLGTEKVKCITIGVHNCSAISTMVIVFFISATAYCVVR